MNLVPILLPSFMLAALMAARPAMGLRASAGLALAASLAAGVQLLALAPAVIDGQRLAESWTWVPALGLEAAFRLDGLGLLLALLIVGIGTLIVIYAAFYLTDQDPPARFFASLLLFQGAMLGIALSDHVVWLLLFWELTSLASFLLIGYWNHRPEGRQGARMALAVTGAGGLALLAGMLLLGEIVGSYRLGDILRQGQAIAESPLYMPALLLILLGCFTKSAQFPFHFWLPRAMAAPTPVSAYLHSATMVKAGVFLLARLWPALSVGEAWSLIVAPVGALTLLVGAAVALFKHDLKALLAYSTVSHLGLITLLLGLGTPVAALAAVFHLFNHALFKAALFMSAGIVDHETGSRDIRRLGGLAAHMPVTATLAMLATAAMAGLPPMNGFISKEMLLGEVWAARTDGPLGTLLLGLTVLAACLSVAYSLRYALQVFTGPRRDAALPAGHDPAPGMWAPPALLAGLALLVGLWPQGFAVALIEPAAAAVTLGQAPTGTLALWHGFNPALLLSLCALAVGVLLYRSLARCERLVARLPVIDAGKLFHCTIAGLVAGANALVTTVHGGTQQRGLFVLCAVALVLGVAGMWMPPAGGQPVATLVPPSATPIAVLAWAVMVAGTLAVVLCHRQRLLALVLVGTVGLIVSLSFLYLSAPDLALTQIAVEVVSVILMLLALNRLPRHSPRESSPALRLRDGAISIAIGGALAYATWMVLHRAPDTLSGYYLAHSLSEGGGRNVVNVILVDFRGFDTFGEIIVLGIAALIVCAVCDRGLRQMAPTQRLSGDPWPLPLVIGAEFLMPLIFAVAAYVFLRGHNAPGGGFIAGLVFAIALLMQFMARGRQWAAPRMALAPHKLIASGVLIAAATGAGAWLVDHPFLTSTVWHLHLPLLGEVHVASAMAFDTGVLLTVIGATLLAMLSLAGDGATERRS